MAEEEEVLLVTPIVSITSDSDDEPPEPPPNVKCEGPIVNYRSEIDGLRAIAIAGVITDHAFPWLLPGGYLGVDVFFVISGYLMTRVINSAIKKDSFTFIGFYERRVRRILPALVLIQMIILLPALIILPAKQLYSYLKSFIAANFLVQNFYFWSESGYFDQSAATKPLGHLWSLSVGEQFYLVLPLLLIQLKKVSRRVSIAVFILICLASLISTHFLRTFDPSLNFYCTTSRIWEMAIGAIVSLIELPCSSRVLNTFALVGIVGSFFTFTPETPHPSLITCIPVISTAIILCNAKDEGGKKCNWPLNLLSLLPFTGVGLISYSLYLWHQPVFAFAILYSPSGVTNVQMVGLMGITAGLSTIWYIIIEQPFRNKDKIPSKFIWILPIFQTVVLTLATVIIMVIYKYPEWMPVHSEHSTQQRDANHTWVLLGDSHAYFMDTVLKQKLESKNITLNHEWKRACPLLFNFHCPVQGKDHCYEHNQQLLNKIQTKRLSASVVVIAVFWLKYYNGGLLLDEHNQVGQGFMIPCYPVKGYLEGMSYGEALLTGYYNSINEILNHNYSVSLVYSIPSVGFNPILRMKQMKLGGTTNTTISWSHSGYVQRQLPLTNTFDRLSGYHLTRIHPDEVFCNTLLKGSCVANNGDTMFYFDESHNHDIDAALVADLIINKTLHQ